MRQLFFVFLLCVCSSSLTISAQEIIADTVQVGDFERIYQYYIPSGYDMMEPMPLVFNFHGLGSASWQQLFYSEMNDVAEAEGFIVAYPQGWTAVIEEGADPIAFWNLGFGEELPEEDRIDDLLFFDTMVENLSADYSIDSDRIYSCGMSMGGFMSYYLACKRADVVTAIASITGSMTSPLISGDCEANRAVPVMQMHGTNDPTVSIDGGLNSPSIQEVVDFWASNNNCLNHSPDFQLEDIDPNDGTTVSLNSYSDCTDGADVVYYIVDGGGHTWPGATFNAGGVTTQDIEASELIWDFFSNYKLSDFSEAQGLNDLSFPVSVQLMQNEIRFQSPEPIARVDLFDLNGQMLATPLIYREKKYQAAVQIETDFPSYILVRLTSEKGSVVSQMIAR